MTGSIVKTGMKTGLLVLLWCCTGGAAVDAFSQDSTTHQTVFPAGIAARMGVGYFATRDEHISDEKYAGPSSSFAILWSRFHETYGFQIGMTYEKASHLKNYNVSAEATQGTFSFVDLYPAGKWDLFGRDAFLYAGPAAEAFVYYRTQNIARNTDSSPTLYQSGAWLLSLGARLDLILPWGGGFQVEGGLQASLLSFGGGTGGLSNGSTSVTLLTPVAGERARGEIGVRYYPLTGLSVAAGYRLDVTRIDSWNFVLESSDNACFSLSWHF
jgi:hypothetical protein